jgi:hypothetical protein
MPRMALVFSCREQMGPHLEEIRHLTDQGSHEVNALEIDLPKEFGTSEES